MYISSFSSMSDTPATEEIRCVNCGELNYLREDRPSGVPEKCGVCEKSLHHLAAQTAFVDYDVTIEENKAKIRKAFNVPSMLVSPLHKSLINAAKKREEDIVREKKIESLWGETEDVIEEHDKKTKGLNLCPECKAVEGLTHYSTCSKFVLNDYDACLYRLPTQVKELQTDKPEQFKFIDENIDTLKKLCDDTAKEPETEITELVNGRWVTRKE